MCVCVCARVPNDNKETLKRLPGAPLLIGELILTEPIYRARGAQYRQAGREVRTDHWTDVGECGCDVCVWACVRMYMCECVFV